ncbi:MAG: hypothetical protein GY943_23665 [Chloroflexi bacterium]|nr:hypothetical protein [Chloroflexota bacterium]
MLFVGLVRQRQADTWALASMMAKEQGLLLVGLTEDMAKMYDKSVKLKERATMPKSLN